MTKAFITFHPADREYAVKFLEQFGDVITATLIGVSDKDAFIKDTNEASFIEREIREKYLTNSTVTIMLTGKCTWTQRYVDWEIAASLRKDSERGRSGLLGTRLPHLGTGPTVVPERFQDNLKAGYAVFKTYPATSEDLRAWIVTARAQRQCQSGQLPTASKEERQLQGIGEALPHSGG